MITYNLRIGYCIVTVMCLTMVGLLASHNVIAQTASKKAVQQNSKEEKTEKKDEPKKAPPAGPFDEFERGNPRSSAKGFFKAARDGDYERAAKYLDFRNLPRWMGETRGSKLTRQLKIVLDRSGLWVDFDLVSTEPEGNLEDGLAANREIIGQIKLPTRTVDILLQQVPRKDGVPIWKFSNRTVAEIPALYRQFGYRPFEEKLSKIFPDFTFLGWQSWQWVMLLVFIGLAYMATFLPTWIVRLILSRKDTEMDRQMSKLFTKPLRVVLWLVLVRIGVQIIGPSATLQSMFRSGTLLIIAFAYAGILIIDIVFNWWGERLRKTGQEAAALLRPVKTFFKIVIVLLFALLWLDNIGFNVSTLLAGLGVGGLAVALAAQDTLKNFIGSIMILLDKPYRVGQRIIVKGHDGVVEEIGLRSTKMRLLTGHLTTIPNDEMARTDVENIGRRPHIRRLTNISITYDTPPDKVEKAVSIILEILDDHEGMDPEFPPRAYFNEFKSASLNLIVIYWYHPADYWGFMQHSQQVNLQIMQRFEAEDIKFAFPTTTTYLTQDDGQPFQINVAGSSQLAGENALA
jgi:MscS family membrane protein